MRVLWEVGAGRVGVDALVRVDQLGEVEVGELDVLLDAARRLQVGERLLEAMAVDSVDDLAVHLDQAPERVTREARVAGGLRETLDRVVVQPEVQDRVHHPRHRHGRAGADGDEERVVGIAEALARLALEGADVLLDLAVEARRQLPVGAHVRTAGVGRDGEARRDRDAEPGHLGEAGALAAEQLAPTAGVLVEGVDVAHGRASSHKIRRT